MPYLRIALMLAVTASFVVASHQHASAGQAAPSLTAKGAPKRHDGYWEFTSIGASGTAMDKQFLCVGSGSEDKYSIFDQLSELGDCSKKEFTRTPTGWNFETRCSMMNVTTVPKGTISGDFQSSFRVDQTVTQSSGGSIVGRRIGDCPAKYKAGDLVHNDGSALMNVLK